MTTQSGYEGPGIYRHYKGGEYEVLGLAMVEASLDKTSAKPGAKLIGDVEVIYRPLTPGSLLSGSEIAFWSRPLDNFNEEPFPAVPRFMRKEGF